MANRLRFFLAQGVLAFSPALLVLLVARGDASAGGDLSVALAVIGALYSVAYLGQRGYVSVRGFEVVPGRSGLTLRLASSLAMAIPALLVSTGMGLPLQLAIFVVALKLSESIVDLWVGMRIRLSSDEHSSRDFLLVSILRTAFVLTPVVLLGPELATRSPWMTAYLAALAATAYLATHFDTRRLGLVGSYAVTPRDALRYAWIMRSFAGATLVCAVLSSLPRVLLPHAEPETYAAPALALSIVPILGLACQALWLGNVRRMTQAPAVHARRFVLEIAGVVAVAWMLWPLWSKVAELAYGLEDAAQRASFASMVAAGAGFVGAIGLANLFKLTERPRMEAFTYTVGVLGLLVGVYVLGASARSSLLGASGAMVLFLLVGIRGRLRPLAQGSLPPVAEPGEA